MPPFHEIVTVLKAPDSFEANSKDFPQIFIYLFIYFSKAWLILICLNKCLFCTD